MADFSIVRLSPTADIPPFDCGNEDINDFLANDAVDYQDCLLAVITKRPHNPQDLLRCLTGSVDHFRHALACSPVKIHFCVADIFKRLAFQLQKGIIDGNGSVFYAFQKISGLIVHDLEIPFYDLIIKKVSDFPSEKTHTSRHTA